LRCDLPLGLKEIFSMLMNVSDKITGGDILGYPHDSLRQKLCY